LNIWDLYIVSPLVNVLIVISSYLFHNFGLTIIVFTLIIRAAMWPLTIKQLRATKAMQSIQTQMAELQKKYGKDRRMLAQEQMKLYRQSGMNPAGCVLPMLVQLPVWIALYQAIIKVLAAAPEDFLSLSRYLYTSWPMVLKTVPLQSHFLWMDLAVPDTIFLLPILTGASMWVQQKMSTMPNPDPKQAQQSQMMLWMMPLMFVFLSMSFPSGLALYWVTSNVVGIVMQYFVTGWGGLIPSKGQNKGSIIDRKTKEPTPAQAPQLEAGRAKSDKGAKSAGGEVEHGESRGTGQDRGGGYAPGTRPARANPRRSTGRRRKGR
jgi:YidC/Oxa1 family membrane protein insertase